MRKEKYIYKYFILFLFIIFIFTLESTVLASTPKLVNTIEKAFENIEEWLIKIATPAAAVGTATGLFMQKFSFGDEEKIRTGKKLVKTSLFSYAFILALDLILSAIKSLI